MIQRLLVLSWVENSRGAGCGREGFAMVVARARGIFSAIALGFVLNCGLSASAQAQSVNYVFDFRRNGPLFQDLAEPPPATREITTHKAPSGEPAAPLMFSGVMHITEAKFESLENYAIGASRAVINTHEGVLAHFGGAIGNEPGSPHGLTKLGAGTLALSGANTYTGASGLLQGGLQVRGSSGWGWASLHASVGTWLEYAPGITIASPLHVSTLRIQDWAPPGSYGVVAAPEHAAKLRWVVREGVAVHAGLLQGDAPFVKQGAGRLSIVGDAMAYSGAALVEQGALAINEMFGGSVAVGPGARLEGVGVVGQAQVLGGGTLAPGNSIGALSIMGDLVFEPGSRFEAEVDPSGAADLVQVGGKALLAGHVLALARAGVWRASTSYIVLRANLGFEGSRFDSVSVPVEFAFLEPRISYEPNAVLLTLVRNDKPLADVAENPDDEEVAEALDEEAPVVPSVPAGDATAFLRDELLLLSRAGARDALRQLSGNWSASVLSSLAQDSRFVRQAALDNARTRGFWSRGIYSSAARRSVHGVYGDRRLLHGLVLGANRNLGGWMAGGVFGIQHAALRRDGLHGHATDASMVGGLWEAGQGLSGGNAGAGAVPQAGSASARIQSTHLGFVVSGPRRPLQVSAGASHTWHRVKSQRRVAFGGLDNTLNASYAARTMQGFAEASWPVRLGAASPALSRAPDDEAAWNESGRPLLLEPFARFAYVSVQSRSVAESGGPAALAVRPARHALKFSTLGLRVRQAVETRWGALRLQGQLAWRYAAGARETNTRQFFRDAAQPRLFASQGLPVARSAWSLDLSLAARISKRSSAMLTYAGQFARGSRDHGVQISMQWAF